MKPNKEQRKVLQLSATLPPLTCEDTNFDWDEKEMGIIDELSYNSSYYCDGRWWEPEYSECVYSAQLVNVENYQVIRYFAMDGRKVGRNCWYVAFNGGEVAQRWFKDGRQVAFVARKAHNNHIHWCFNTPMKIRKDYDFGYLDSLGVHSVYGKAFAWNLSRFVMMNGYNGYSYSRDRDDSFIFSPVGEFLYKCEPKLYEYVAKNGGVETADLYLPSIRVAHRHKYEVDDIGLWFDYLKQLDELGKDLRNPQVICPADLIMAHERTNAMIMKKREKELRADREKVAKSMVDEQKAYEERLGIYFGIAFSSEHLDIIPLKSIAEFYSEGEMMHHCVYANKYYEKNNCLILSAKDKEGARVETIEIDLLKGLIVQSRAQCNGVSRFHEEILQAVNGYMPNIMAIKRNERTRVAA